MILIDEVSKAIAKPIKDLGYSDFKVSLKREKGTLTLEVLVDKDDAISLDDIITVNDTISPILDGLDLINEPYMLDVSSFGAEKPIDVSNLEKYVGKYVNLHLSNPYKGLNNLEGDLKAVNEKEVSISIKEKARVKEIILNRDDIDKARLAIKF